MTPWTITAAIGLGAAWIYIALTGRNHHLREENRVLRDALQRHDHDQQDPHDDEQEDQ